MTRKKRSPLTDEQRQNISEGMRTPEAHARISESQTRRWANPEERLAQSGRLAGKKKSLEHRRHISEGRAGIKFSEEHKRKIGEANLGNKNACGPRTEAQKIHIRMAHRRPEVRKKLRESAKRRWRNPEARLEQGRRIKRAKRLNRERRLNEQL